MSTNKGEKAVVMGIVSHDKVKELLPYHEDEYKCHIFEGKIVNRYGRVKVAGITVSAHRLAWTLLKGEIPDMMTLDHRINCPRHCINPDHLEVCTRVDNSIRASMNRVVQRQDRPYTPIVMSLEDYHKAQKPTLSDLREAVNFD